MSDFISAQEARYIALHHPEFIIKQEWNIIKEAINAKCAKGGYSVRVGGNIDPKNRLKLEEAGYIVKYKTDSFLVKPPTTSTEISWEE